MHLLIKWCRNVRVGMWVPLKRGVLVRYRQTQSLSLSLGLRLRLSLSLDLVLDLDRRHGRLEGGCDIVRLAHIRFRAL